MSEVIDSSVSRQPGVRSTTSTSDPVTDDGQGNGNLLQMYIAPALRVEELRDERVDEVPSGSSVCGTDDEFTVSAGDLSDQDAGQNRAVSSAETEFVTPDEELQKRIVIQVEHYFADENILHDTFMLKHVRRNRLGYVSLKLVTSFRKVKPLTRDHRVVAYSLRNLSECLEVNDEGTKVRRRNPIPDVDENSVSRTVLVAGLPMEAPTMENISEILAGCGEMVSVRIWRAGKAVPSDVKKHVSRLGAEYATAACAVVEFDDHELAKKACELMEKTGAEHTLQVKASLFVMSKSDRPKKGDKTSESSQKNLDHDSNSENWREGTGRNQDNKGKILKENPKSNNSSKTEWRRSVRVNELANEGDIDSAGSESDASADNWRSGKPRNSGGGNGVVVSRSSLSPQMDPNRLSPCQSPRTTPRTTPKSSPKSSPRTSPNSRRRTLGTSPLAVDTSDERRKSVGSSPSHSPWVQRRLKAQEASVSPLAGNSVNSSPRLGRKNITEDNVTGAISRFADAVGVIRQPKGPDGTRGFQGGGSARVHLLEQGDSAGLPSVVCESVS